MSEKKHLLKPTHWRYAFTPCLWKGIGRSSTCSWNIIDGTWENPSGQMCSSKVIVLYWESNGATISTCIIHIQKMGVASPNGKVWSNIAKLPCSIWASLVDVEIIGQMNEDSKNVQKNASNSKETPTTIDSSRNRVKHMRMQFMMTNKHISYWNAAEPSLSCCWK